MRQTLAEAMSRCGFDVATASDGDEAIKLFDCGDVHLIIVDFHMPRVSGLEVIRHVRSRSSVMPCILMSAELSEAVRQEAERMRACGIFDKPLRLANLRQTVQQSLLDIYGWKAG
jgi:DNA-binding response OmpR family regulator